MTASTTNPAVAVVTGGAGGIGRPICHMLADRGYRVVVADADAAAAQSTVAALPGEQHVAFAGDLSTTEANRRLVGEAIGCGTLTVLVNAVGISPKGPAGQKISFFEITEDDWDTVLAVNLKAPFLLVKEAYSVMPADGSASIVNILSITAKLAAGGPPDAQFPPFLPSGAAYAASKAGLQNLTATLSRELAERRVRVNGVAPGLIATSMTGAVQGDEALSRQVPMSRFGRPDEVIGAVEFLVSDRASYITGTSLDVNGGWLTC